MRRFVAELSAIVVCAALCAAVSNYLAGRERKLAPVGRYPNALTLPKTGTPEPAAASPEAPPTGAAANSPAVPVQGASSAPETSLPTSEAKGAAASPARSARPAGPGRAPASAPLAAPAAPGAPVASPGGTAALLARFPPHPDRPFVEISGADALWAHGRAVVFLDARRSKVYEEGHVAGARSFSVWEADVDPKVFAFQDEVAKDLPVVLYCSGGDCEDSHMLADKLFGAGFGNVLVYRDGWPDWVKRGGPVRTGPTP